MVPSIKGLQALAALARASSLTEAAAVQGVTRSALSHRIADLERQLGVMLVRQAGRRAALTDDARALLAVMGDALDRIEAAVEPFRRGRGELRISTVATFASLWLIPRLADWQRRHPGIALAIATSTRPIDFATDDFDCAIRHGLGGWPGLAETLLFRETLLPVARPGGPALSPASVAIRARSRFRDWHRWWQGAGEPGTPPERGMVVENRAQAMDAVLAGAGVAMMDAAYAAPHLADGSLCALGPTVALPEGYYLVEPRDGARNAGATRLLRAWLLEQAT